VSESTSSGVAISETVEVLLETKFSPTDALKGKFNSLAEHVDLPVLSVCAFLHDKMREKRSKGYVVQSAGALYDMAREDILGWAKQNWRQIECDRKLEAAAAKPAGGFATMPAAPEPPQQQQLLEQIEDVAKSKAMR
jgi:hypothetical protein